jgi:hypothetical protein
MRPMNGFLISAILVLPALLAPAQTRPVPVVSQGPSPFAYIREDGSEIYVPASGSAEIPDIEETEPVEDGEEGEVGDLDRAVYTWSSAVS